MAASAHAAATTSGRRDGARTRGAGALAAPGTAGASSAIPDGKDRTQEGGIGSA
jgi:hypothetical protein